MRFYFIPCKSSARRSGFTLIELMITMAIIAILVSIALPSYASYRARARRADARTQLLQVAQFMQRFYAANDSYKSDRSGNAVLTQVPANLRQSPGDSSSTVLYALAIPEATLGDMRYTLQMVPVITGAMAGDECGTLTLDATGLRGVVVGGAAGSTGVRDLCWR